MLSFANYWYYVFLFCVAVLFFSCKQERYRRLIMFSAGVFFYASFGVAFLPILLFVILVSFVFAKIIKIEMGENTKSWIFGFAILALFSPLLWYKYLHFFSSISCKIFLMSGLPCNTFSAPLLLPIGISFYSFQAAGYLIDVYTGRFNDENYSILDHTQFMTFFPLLLMGPIERADSLSPQLTFNEKFNYERVVQGCRLILLGLFMKIVIANEIEAGINPFFGSKVQHTGFTYFVAIILYSFQAYADFCGYSNMAIGTAKIFGIEVRPNFSQPFLSQTVPDFWRNWHKSLMSWFQDYIYSPLSMAWRRLRTMGICLSIAATFLLSGIWHGAGSKYICFALVHVFLVIFSVVTLKQRNKIWMNIGILKALKWPRIIMTFLTVTLSFVFFRADNVQMALEIYARIFSLSLFSIEEATPMLPYLLGAAFLIGMDLFQKYNYSFAKIPTAFRWIAYQVGFLLIVVYFVGTAGRESGFIYFKF